MFIKENIARVFEAIETACHRAGRNKKDVQLIAVTKKVPVDRIMESVRYGITDIGESRIQESLSKFQTLNPSVQLKWHMIGHLQSNKVNRAVEIFDMIQSVDSIACLERVNRSAERLGKVQDCLVELKVSPEHNKSGLSSSEMSQFIDSASQLKNVAIKGLMTIPPYFDDAEKSRSFFAEAKRVFDQHFSKEDSLSMGMSGDFTVAIEEGSTMVRVGQAIYGTREIK